MDQQLARMIQKKKKETVKIKITTWSAIVKMLEYPSTYFC